MKPEMPTPSVSPEQFSMRPEHTIEHNPGTIGPEVGLDKSAEHYEQRSEAGAISSDVSFATSLPTPVYDDTQVVQDTTMGTTPLVANDDDLIEKEWVDRAKKIVEETKNDPYRREEAVNKLQVDYLKKRYGRELGAAE